MVHNLPWKNDAQTAKTFPELYEKKISSLFSELRGLGERLTNHRETPVLRILQKLDGTAWTGFIWLRIGA